MLECLPSHDGDDHPRLTGVRLRQHNAARALDLKALEDHIDDLDWIANLPSDAQTLPETEQELACHGMD